jgi:hypothetical protein
VNDRYVDRNYGGILIVWDRLFGSFEEERDDQPCVYGTRSPLRSFNPLWANLEVYWALGRDAWRARRWRDKFRLWFMPPGWRPADVAAADPKPAFRLASVQRFDPPMSRAAQAAALVVFIALLGGACALLWQAHRLSLGLQLAGTAAIVAGLWVVGRLSERGALRPPAVAPS